MVSNVSNAKEQKNTPNGVQWLPYSCAECMQMSKKWYLKWIINLSLASWHTEWCGMCAVCTGCVDEMFKRHPLDAAIAAAAVPFARCTQAACSCNAHRLKAASVVCEKYHEIALKVAVIYVITSQVDDKVHQPNEESHSNGTLIWNMAVANCSICATNIRYA